MERRAATAEGCGIWFVPLLLLLLPGLAPARQAVAPGSLPFVELELPAPGRVDLISQDSGGSLWIATHEGLYLFDGRHFQRVPEEQQACQPGIRKLVAGVDGEMWCLGVDVLARWRQGRWHQLELPSGVGWPGQDLAPDGKGGVWLLTAHGLLHAQAGQDSAEPVAGWTGQMPRAVWAQGSGVLYVTAVGRVHRRGVDGQWSAWGSAEGLPAEQLVGVAEDGQGRVWTWSGKGTWVLPPGARAFIPTATVGNDVLGMAAAVDGRGQLWWAGPRGLFHQDAEVPLAVEGLPAGWLSHVFVDREGSVWVAGGAGLFRLAGRGMWRKHVAPHGLPAEAPWALQRDTDGQLWAGSSRGLARATATGWQWDSSLWGKQVRFILPAPQGALWLAVEREVWRYEPRTGTVLRLGREQGLADGMVQALAWEAPGTLWVGTSAGLFRASLTGRTPRLVPVELAPQGELTPVSDLARDGQGQLWVASVKGLFLVRAEGVGHFTAADGLRSTWVGLLALRRSGELCVSYENVQGLSCFRPEHSALGALWHLERSAGSRAGSVHFMGEDARGRLWVGGDDGVDVLTPEGGVRVALYTVADGLPGDDCASRSFLAEPDGTVWVGTRAGLGQFLGSEEVGPVAAPATLLERLDEQGRLTPAPPELVLPAEAGHLELEVTARTLSSQHAVEHQSRLVGSAQDFQPMDSALLRLSGLEPGPHELQVRSRVRYGAWGPAASLRFTVVPAWWRSAWVPATSVVLLALAGLLGFRLRQHVLQRRNAELQALVSLRTAELARAHERLRALERSALERRLAGGFAHEMRNALNGAKLLMGRAYRGAKGTSLPEDTSGALLELYQQVRPVLSEPLHSSVATLLRQANAHQEQLDAVLRAVDSALGRALAITRQILEYAQLGREQPGQETVALRPLVEAVLDESREALRGVSVQLEVPEGCSWVGRQEHFYSVLKNLVLNALDALEERPAEAERRLGVRVEPQPGACVLRVEDTGAGIAEEQRGHLFQPFFSTKPDKGRGLGLAMVARLVELYEGRIDVDSEPGRGTTFLIHLPDFPPPRPPA